MRHIAPLPLEHDATAAWLSIRRLEPTERGALARHLLALPYEDRCARFDGVMGDGAIVAHCAALDLARDGDVIATAAWQGATRALFQFRLSNIAVANLVRHLGGVADRAAGAGEVPIGADAR